MDEDYSPQLYYAAAGNGLVLAAYVLDIIGCVTMGVWAVLVNWWWLIPLCWMIPMTYMAYLDYKGERPNTVAFGVCTLIFTNIISGILLLCAPKDEVTDPAVA